MRAKFYVESITKMAYGGEVAKLRAIYSNGKPEDNQFAKATPNGTIEITIDNPSAQGFLVPGKNYYLDFTPTE